MSNDDDMHLDVYKNRSELHTSGRRTVFWEGKQNPETAQKYAHIYHSFENGFYREAMKAIPQVLEKQELTADQQSIIKALVNGITSETGRAVVGLSCLQMAIKAIEPTQCIRLHKGGPSENRFSWQEGISMRTLDKAFNTPFLREYGLLNMNKDGNMMTRSLAENYPYSQLYKAEMRGPFDYWIDIVESLEDNSLKAYSALCFLLSLLKNRSDDFAAKANKVVALARKCDKLDFSKIRKLMVNFFSNTSYSARAFEIIIHSFVQAAAALKLTDGNTLVPLSQMRSANKKHGNVGDIELKNGDMIIESWDAKYGKPYLRDELEELNDKLNSHPDVEIAGFIVNTDPTITEDILAREEEIEHVHGCKICLLSFDKWIDEKISGLSKGKLKDLGYEWVVAAAESFGQKRMEIAPIDEPCDLWIEDLTKIIIKYLQ